MSSAQEQRQQLIAENIPKLIKSLTGFNEGDENFTLCINYAFGSISNHHYLSINSHEIRRKIDDLAERFAINNYTRYGDRFKQLCQRLIENPSCATHYEYDIEWKLLHFLLEVARNPVNSLTENLNRIQLDEGDDDEENEIERERQSERERIRNDLIQSLIGQNNESIVSAKRQSTNADSDLSEWSDDEDEDAVNSVERLPPLPTAAIHETSTLKLIRTNEINPPQKPLPFIEFDSSKSADWMRDHVQSSWWLQSDFQTNVSSRYADAQMCQKYQTAIKKLSGGTVKLPSVSTVSEWCLMREIIWLMQINDVNISAKFFTIDATKSEIVVNPNVSMSSVTLSGIRGILIDFSSFMTKLYRLRQFIHSVFCDDIESPPHTIECYASSVQSFLTPLSKYLDDKEKELIEQNPLKVHSIIGLRNELQPYVNMLDHLYDIHVKCYLDFHVTPAHECTLHLITSLIQEIEMAAVRQRLNLAAAHLFVALKFYLFLFDRWWFEGHFDDWRNEFVVEKYEEFNGIENPTTNIYRLRTDIETNDEITDLIYDRVIDAGNIIGILFNLNKLNEMRETRFDSGSKRMDSYECFLDELFVELMKFQIKNEEQMVKTEANAVDKMPSVGNALDLTEYDPLLQMVFNECAQQPTINVEVEDSTSAFNIYERLNQITEFHLPIIKIVHDVLKNLFDARILAANQFVLNIFTKEYRVVEHITNLEKVFFFGVGDLMQTFCWNLFQNMTNNEPWNNPYLLTVKLDGILSSRYSSMKNLFSVQLLASNSDEKAPLEAIKDFNINYAVREQIRDVIHDDALIKYNEVFRFLMQIKWAIWTLETLRFPLMFKRRSAYAPLTLIDLTFRRLALVRNWIIYSIQCVHSHIMSFVIESMGRQLVRKMERAKCLREIIELHDSYIKTVHNLCFRKRNDKNIRTGIDQLLNLTEILASEWNNLAALDTIADVTDGDDVDVEETVSQIDAIENTYINCHCFLAEALSKEVFSKDREDLAALSAAFNCSCPY